MFGPRPVWPGMPAIALGLAAAVMLSACDGQPQPAATPAPTGAGIFTTAATLGADPTPELAKPAPVKPSTAEPAPPTGEREALVALYHATNGPGWENSENWLTDAPLDQWHGVSVDHEGSVISLMLEENGLAGPIPPQLGSLTNLSELRLYHNELSGSIPPELGGLRHLEYLGLAGNQLTGRIPPELGDMPNLISLDLGSNQLTGRIPPELGDLSNVKTLGLGDNQLTGSIPPELARLSGLFNLRLGLNQLTGPIPPELGNLSSLKNLDLGDNQLTGSVPPELGRLSNLETMWLDVNQLTGSIPPELGGLSNLTHLSVEYNQLTGPIPPALDGLSNVVLLILGRNQISGPIPPELGSLPNLWSLGLDESQLTGPIPPELGNAPNLTVLSLRVNQLTGPIPPELGNASNLRHLMLDKNQLTGHIPPQLAGLSNLTVLWLSGNELTGCVPLGLAAIESNDLHALGLRACEDPAPTLTPTPTPTPGHGPTTVPAPNPNPTPLAATPVEALVQGNSAFALDLYSTLAAEEGNLFFSPYSISLALAMTYVGARGETERQMAEVLGFPSQDTAHDAFNALAADLAARSEAQRESLGDAAFRLNIANSVWGQEGHPFLQPFLDTLEESYGAGVRTADFRKSPEDARLAINGWVEENTEGRIMDLIPPDVIDDVTRMVLANAIYFDAQWENQFAEDATKMEPFYLPDSASVDVPIMNVTEEFGYADGDGYQAVGLPYLGGASMLAIVPDRGSFREFEQSLDSETVSRIIEQLTVHEVTLKMPKFEFESEFKLAETLMAMGMPNAVDDNAFASKADFSGMDGAACIAGDRPCLAIKEVIHKTFVAVDEAGTEAAAATAVAVFELMGYRPPPPKVTLTIDRPFIFLIQDWLTVTIFFLGRVEAP